MAMVKKYSIKLNNNDKIEQLLQETYDLCCQQHKMVQDEINKIANTTTLKDLDIEGKEKYAKIMNNYMALQQKAINQKFDIARLMSEVVKHGGNVEQGIEAAKSMPTTLDLDKLRELAINATTGANETKEYKMSGNKADK